jgi:sugar O-acyltransferase (sialic acid O-acetyltransferase NeuD family)
LRAYFRTTFSSEYVIHLVDKRRGSDIISLSQYYKNHKSGRSIMGTGKPAIKRKMLTQIKEPLITFIHPQAVTIQANIGRGVVIAPGSVIAPNATIGDHVLINYNATIGHDAVVGALAVVSPNASVGGFCKIGDGAYVGSGAQIRENLTIGKGATVGMGAVVTKDIPPGVVAKGVPARW